MKRVLFLLSAVLVAASMMAAPVDQATARLKAQSYLKNELYAGKIMAPAALNPVLLKAEIGNQKLNQPVYYIFNTSTTFLVIAGDDRAEDILMIGDQPLDMNRIPDGMQYMLDCYKEQIEFLQERPGLVVEKRLKVANPRLTATTYGPLLTCNWDQEAPYNNLCKFTYNNQTYTCLTGCPATSASMVMYYWKYPNSVPALPAYTSTLDLSYYQSVNFTYPSLPATTFDWANMKDNYNSYSTAQGNAVATLMRYVGQAEKMMYGTYSAGGSGIYTSDTQVIVNMFRNWGYESTCKVIHKYSYSEANWATAIQNEMIAGRPIVFMAVDSDAGGHAFNVDGYRDSDSKYHVNFGWSGSGNSWYSMNAFSYGGDTFNQDQQAVIGIQVNTGPELTVDPTSLSFTAYSGETATQTFTVTGKNLTGNVNLSVSGTGYTISPSTLTASQAANGATVTVTYKPTATGTHTGTVTVASSGAESQTVSLSGTASTKPALTATQSSLSFSTSVGSTATKTFVVRGTNLVNVVTLTASGHGFSVSPTTIAKSTATNGKTVTVTYSPTEAGNHTGAITITSTDADPVTVTLNGTAADDTPLIGVNPSSLSFTGVTEQTYTKTFTVTGANLTGNLTLTLNNANGIYSINKTSITASQAASGATVTVTYAPVAAGSTNASVTISGGGAASKTVSLDGTATEPVRTITATPNALTFANIVGETVTKTFNVTGENLKGDLTLALNDQNGVYSIEPTTMTAAEATAGKTVTVTYAPTAFGTHNATVTISGGSANAVTVTLAGQADLTKFAPTMLEANDLFVALSRFRAEWTDNTPEENVTSYTLEVSPKSVEPEVNEVSTADFTTIEAVTNDEGTLPNCATNATDYLPNGWTADNYLFINDGFVITGASSSWWSTTYGDIKSPTLDLTGYDKVTVVVSVMSYYPSNYGIGAMRVATGSDYEDYTLGSSDDDDFATYTVVLNCATSDQVTIQARQNYIAIQSVHVYAGDLTETQNKLMATETGDATHRLIEGITADTKYYTVENLTEGGTFLYRVKALYIDGTESDWSNIEEVTLHENEHPYQIGDVNHDNVIDVTDVTVLISYVLGNNNGACPVCSDFNGDGNIDVTDVTTLINFVLGNEQTIKAAAKHYYLLAL